MGSPLAASALPLWVTGSSQSSDSLHVRQESHTTPPFADRLSIRSSQQDGPESWPWPDKSHSCCSADDNSIVLSSAPSCKAARAPCQQASELCSACKPVPKHGLDLHKQRASSAGTPVRERSLPHSVQSSHRRSRGGACQLSIPAPQLQCFTNAWAGQVCNASKHLLNSPYCSSAAWVAGN